MRSNDEEDDDDSQAELDENPDPSDMDTDDGPQLVKCPYCGKMISEETEICHLCGSYILEPRAEQVPGWFWIGIILAVAAIIWWLLFKV